jgi:hypothetical protein
VAGKEIAVKKYVVRLDAEERDRLNELIRKGKRSAQLEATLNPMPKTIPSRTGGLPD